MSSNYLDTFTNESIEKFLTIGSNDLKLVGFCHNIRINKKMIFVVLRKGINTIQLIIFKNKTPDQYEIISKLNNEATIDVVGTIVKATVKSCTVTNYEIQLKDVIVINPSKKLPFSLDDANETFHSDSIEDEKYESDKIDEKKEASAVRCKVDRMTRLDNRWIDLRIPINQKIFKLGSHMEACMRNILIEENFFEIHTPKIIPAVSEGGANVFEVNYFGKKVFLAQSPQLYKQMMINAGFGKVFEVGPVFRAENANTYRHLCEFMGIDFEFEIRPDQNHIDIIKTIWHILYGTFETFYAKHSESIDYVLEKTNTKPLIFPKDPVIIDFQIGCKMLNETGHEQDPLDDIGSINEKILGELVKEKYKTDVYALVGYPNAVRPFYTMPQDETYSRSFDIMMRGNEISSGAQRVHDPVKLKQAILNKGIKLDGESGLEDYLRSFETGSLPHGGCGIGLGRLLMLYLGLPNIRNATLFPRDPKRITP
jgi:nondiscriminating aspartyl-tRNA synthetase